MLKLFSQLSILTFVIVLVSSCSNANGDQTIDLNSVYRNAADSDSSNAGNFFKATTGIILFINPAERKKLRPIVLGQAKTCDFWCKTFNPVDSSITNQNFTVSKRNNSLFFGNHEISEQELERMRLTPDWIEMADYLVKAGRVFLPDASYVRLAPYKFLVSGGLIAVRDSLDPKYNQAEKNAFIFDLRAVKVCKSILLKQHRFHHLSLLLPDGQVLLVGGNHTEEVEPCPELIDPARGTTRIIHVHPSIQRIGATAYIDDQGNCVILGGVDSKGASGNHSVVRLDVKKGTLEQVGKLPHQHSFDVSSIDTPSVNAIQLTPNKILIAGGRGSMGLVNLTLSKEADIVTLSP